jgi:hypothetical protein
VQNIKQVQLMSGPAFPSHKDHSKWAIAAVVAKTLPTSNSSFREITSLKKDRFRQQQQQQQPWVVCVGDINRMVGNCVCAVIFNLVSTNLLA